MESGGPAPYFSQQEIFNCNVFNLMVGFLYFEEGTKGNPDITSILQLHLMYNSSMLNRMAYNASFASASVHVPDTDPVIYTQQWRQEAYQFCIDATSKTCNFMIFSLYDNVTTSVSQFNYQLVNGSCTDTMMISKQAWYACIYIYMVVIMCTCV